MVAVDVYSFEPDNPLQSRWGIVPLTHKTKSGLRNNSTINRSTEAIDHHPHQQEPQNDQAAEIQPEPPDGNNEGENDHDYEPRPPKPDWVISIKEKLEQACQDDMECLWEKVFIHRIPRYLMDGDDKAYVPQIVSLGPYHHGKVHLRHMEQHKWRCLHRILKRSNHKIDVYLESVRKVEKRARACYEGPISMSSDDFVLMMVLDGCFVIELFQRVVRKFEEPGNPVEDPILDPVFSKRESIHMIRRDMIMLENQIPLFILDRLLCLEQHQSNQKGHMAEMALQFFDLLMPTDGDQPKLSDTGLEPNQSISKGELSCLELFRWRLLRSGPKKQETKASSQKRKQIVHCVTELREAGIKFRVRKLNLFWDIQFEDGVLWIPQLQIHDGTRSLFLNLIAFEQSHFYCSNVITAYVIFMDQLINSPEDVKQLHSCSIIEHWLGSDTEVADLFNQLCKDVVFDLNDNYLYELSEKVNKYCTRRCNRWRATLMHNYFHNPWAIISLLAALVLLVLTLTQTFYGVYGYYRLGS